MAGRRVRVFETGEAQRTRSILLSRPLRTLRLCASTPFHPEIAEHGYVLTPGRYVGGQEVQDDGVTFVEKMAALTSELADQFAESAQDDNSGDFLIYDEPDGNTRIEVRMLQKNNIGSVAITHAGSRCD